MDCKIGKEMHMQSQVISLNFFSYKELQNFAETTALYWEQILNNAFNRVVSKKVHTILVELIENVIEHTQDKSSHLNLDISMRCNSFVIKISNKVTEDQRLKLAEYIDNINDPVSLSILFNKIINSNNLRGFGLARLKIENNCKLEYSYNKENKYFTIISESSLV